MSKKTKPPEIDPEFHERRPRSLGSYRLLSRLDPGNCFGAATYVARGPLAVLRLDAVHDCFWALCHFKRRDPGGNEVRGPVKPVLECCHGLTVQIPIEDAAALARGDAS